MPGYFLASSALVKRLLKELRRSFSRRSVQSDQSISYVVNKAVRLPLVEDAEDLKAFRERAAEPNLEFVDVVKSLKRRGKV